MSKVIIIVNAEVKQGGKICPTSPVTEKMVTALCQGITAKCGSTSLTNRGNDEQIEVISGAALWSRKLNLDQNHDQDIIYCPLTIQLPEWVDFPAKYIYKACKDIKTRRNWVEKSLGYKTSIGNSWLGDLWLPIVLTQKGPLYGEVIAEGGIPNFYKQPVDLTDLLRQPLYHLAYQLLQSINASPAVYLLQFSLKDGEIIFDRLWPFPATPAIASINVQQPDLFTCHWLCLTEQPILDLKILDFLQQSR